MAIHSFIKRNTPKKVNPEVLYEQPTLHCIALTLLHIKCLCWNLEEIGKMEENAYHTLKCAAQVLCFVLLLLLETDILFHVTT